MASNLIAFLSDPQLHTEVEMLYAVVIRTGLSSEINIIQESIVKYLRDNMEQFNIIKERYLADLEIHSKSESNARRDIIS